MMDSRKHPWWRRRVCFVAPLSYGLFDAATEEQFGGAEVRAVRLARGLAERGGSSVSVIVRNCGQPRRQRFGNLDVIAYREPEDDDNEVSDDRVWAKVSSESFINNTPVMLRPYFTGHERVATYYEVNADGDFEMLVSHLRTLLDDNTTWRHHHEQGLAYVALNHDQGACVDKLIDEIRAVTPESDIVPGTQASAEQFSLS